MPPNKFWGHLSGFGKAAISVLLAQCELKKIKREDGWRHEDFSFFEGILYKTFAFSTKTIRRREISRETRRRFGENQNSVSGEYGSRQKMGNKNINEKIDDFYLYKNIL